MACFSPICLRQVEGEASESRISISLVVLISSLSFFAIKMSSPVPESISIRLEEDYNSASVPHDSDFNPPIVNPFTEERDPRRIRSRRQQVLHFSVSWYGMVW